jgi:hypothetical protein
MLTRPLTSLSLVVVLLASLSLSPCLAQKKSQPRIHIALLDARGSLITDSSKSVKRSGGAPAVLIFEREYQPGDQIVISGPSRMAVRVDDKIPECMIYLANSPHAVFTFDIPFGHGKTQTGNVLSPDGFIGGSHRITARTFTAQELSEDRNLALNACDQQEQPLVFPHASTNSVTRGQPEFQARNAIDGVTENGHHGLWPYQSWGPEQRDDNWWKIDFGRPVAVKKIRLMIRADFPHDGYWKSGVIEFSDGSQLPIQIAPTLDFQDFSFSERKVSWVRINKLVPADPKKWCSFIEVEAWGHDLN